MQCLAWAFRDASSADTYATARLVMTVYSTLDRAIKGK